MKTSRLGRAAALWAVAAVYLFASRPSHAVTTSVLYSEGFTSSSSIYTWSGYFTSFDGWYRASYGRSGANGSVAFNSYYGRYEQAMNSPTMDASGFATTADSTFIEFDLFMPKNYYDLYYGSNTEFYVKVGGTQLLKVTHSDYSSVTVGTYGYTSNPSSYTSTSYWRHYKVLVPVAQRSAAMQIALSAKGTNSQGYYYPYSNNVFIDNIKVSNNHYTTATVTPKSLAFGNLGKGLTSSPQYVVIANPNSTPVNISNVALSGSNPGDYQIVYSPTQIQPGMSDSIGVVFAPQTKNLRVANLTFTTDVDIPRNALIDMTGFCLVPQIVLPNGTSVFRKTLVKFDDMVQATIPFTNTGLAPLLVDTVATYVEGDAAIQYAIVSKPAQPTMPGASDSLVVQFAPTHEGQQAAYLHLLTNADNGEQVLTLHAVGIVPHLEISPRQVLFDSTDLGNNRSVTLTLYNSGTDTLAITHNILTGSDYDYTVTTLNGADTLLVPSQSKTIEVSFHPLRNGTRVGRLHLTTNIPLTFEATRRDTSTFDVSIMGYAIPVGILSTQAPTDTGIVGIESCRTSSFTNTGAADLTITSATIVGRDSAEFSLNGVTFPVTLQVGATEPFTLCTTPSERGDRVAQLVLTGSSNDRSLSVTVPIAAFGLEVCATSTATTQLGSATCAGYTDTAVVTVSNCGDVATNYTAALSAGSSDFAIVGNPTSSSVDATGSTTFRVAYTPTARGTANTTLTITGGTGVSPMTVNLSGSGNAAAIVGSGTAPATAVGSKSAAFEVGVQNTGECDFVPGVPTVTGPFTYLSGGDAVIAPGASGTLMFTYAPTQSGSTVGVVSFPNSTGVSIPAANVTITGATPAAVRASEAYGFSLGQNYPNPFREKAEIEFVVPYTTRVQLDLLDATGNYVASLFSGMAEQGTHSAMVDASATLRSADINTSALSSGTYFYRLTCHTTDGEPVVLVRQMVMVK
jgi:hypothetical protein